MNTIIRLRLESKSDLTIYSTDMHVSAWNLYNKENSNKAYRDNAVPLDVSIHNYS